jgi:predicted outer membrane repeat protein
MKTPAALAASLASLTAATILHAQTRVVYVDQSAPPNGDGTSWQRAFRELQVGLNAATMTQSGSVELRVAQGIQRPRLTTSGITFAFVFDSITSSTSLSILGSFAGLRGPNPDARDYVRTPTVLTGDMLGNDTPDGLNREDNAFYVLLARSTTRLNSVLRLDGLVIEGSRGDSNPTSAATLVTRAGLVQVSHCEFRNNLGTGLSIISEQATIDQCGFSRNQGVYGGGLSIQEGNANVSHSRFEGNSASIGGAIYCDNASVFARRLTLFGNSAIFFGGGIYGAQLVSSSLIAANSASLGGGLFDCETTAHCTIVHNSSQWGGGMHSFGGSVFNSIITANVASIAGSQVSLAQSLLSCSASIIQGGTEDIHLAFAAAVAAERVSNLDPRFVDPLGPDGRADTWQDNDYHLLSRSAAINQGDPRGFDEFDLDGNARWAPRLPGGPALPDLGCYEYQPAALATSTKTTASPPTTSSISSTPTPSANPSPTSTTAPKPTPPTTASPSTTFSSSSSATTKGASPHENTSILLLLPRSTTPLRSRICETSSRAPPLRSRLREHRRGKF